MDRALAGGRTIARRTRGDPVRDRFDRDFPTICAPLASAQHPNVHLGLRPHRGPAIALPMRVRHEAAGRLVNDE
jgi:hypothetical protein